MKRVQDDRGSALITTLLIAALVTIIATGIISGQVVDIRRTANIMEAGQAEMLADSVEAWAVNLLVRDARHDSKGSDPVDSLDEEWGKPLLPTEVKIGTVAGEIQDMQARFNLNNLIHEAPDTPHGKQCRQQFRRLAEGCKLEGEIVNTVTDWLDNDQEAHFPGGAEDAVYLEMQPPYRTADAPMASPSELRLLKGVDASAYQCLVPLISALPEPTLVNVNTAPAVILASLSDKLALAVAENIVEARPLGGYASVDEFLALPELAGSGLKGEFLTVQSRYFMVTARVEFGRARLNRFSMLNRERENEDGEPEIRVLGRTIGVY